MVLPLLFGNINEVQTTSTEIKLTHTIKEGSMALTLGFSMHRVESRLRSIAGLCLLALVGVSLVAEQPGLRDWQRSPAVVELDTAADIYAVGDVHGDYDRLAALLAGAGVIRGVPASPDRPEWNAGTSVLVFTGDLIDKGPKDLAVLTLVRALPVVAARSGGRVVVLMGNHEAEFLAHPDASKGADFAAQLSAAGLRPQDVAACSGELGGFLCSLPFAARIGDWFFSHAGNTDGRTIGQLSSDLTRAVDHDGFAAVQLIGPGSILEARLGEKGGNGRSWFDAANPRTDPAKQLMAYASALGAQHIVEGHQHGATRFPDSAVRSSGEMFNWRGGLFLIDTGMSRQIDDSEGAILHVRQAAGYAVGVCPDGHETPIWEARQSNQSAAMPPCRSRDSKPKP
jgi:hypothetical protein